MEKVQLIIKNALVCPWDRKCFHTHIVVKNSRIQFLGLESDSTEIPEAEYIIDAKGNPVTPSFVNVHTHAAMVLFRGLADDLPLMTWLNEHIWPAEKKWVSAEFVKAGWEVALCEMIKTGTTALLDMYFFQEEAAKVIEKAGIRAVLCYGIIDFPTPDGDTEIQFRKTEEFLKQYRNHPLLKGAVGPHAPYSCSPATIERAVQLALDYNAILHTHIAETKGEFDDIKAKHGKTPVEYMQSLGIFNPRCVMAHGVHLTQDDMEIIKKHNATVAHCPESNLKLASGVCPVPELLNKGVNVALATDGAASNNNLSMVEEMRTMALVHKGIRFDPTVISAKQALQIATFNGAKALGLDGVGEIKEGAIADLIVWNLDTIETLPWYDPFSAIVYSANAQNIKAVICNGKLLYENGELKTLDEERAKAIAKEWREKLK